MGSKRSLLSNFDNEMSFSLQSTLRLFTRANLHHDARINALTPVMLNPFVVCIEYRISTSLNL